MIRLLSSTLLLLVFVSSEAFALPILQDRELRTGLPSSFLENFDFSGIVALDNCSGSLVRFANSADTDQAMVLTNGHCVESGFPDEGTVIYGQQSSRTFDLLKSDASVAGTLTATQIIYSTMTDTDLTLYRLQQTYAQIMTQYGIRPLELASTHPAPGAAIDVLSGYWKRGYSCAIDGFVNALHEDQWIWKDSIRYTSTGCNTVGGTSGSPVLAAGTRLVIGVNNTGSESGEKCTLNNPCEVDASGNITYQKGLSYGEETYWLYSCLNANHEIDLKVAGCLLPKGGLF